MVSGDAVHSLFQSVLPHYNAYVSLAVLLCSIYCALKFCFNIAKLADYWLTEYNSKACLAAW